MHSTTPLEVVFDRQVRQKYARGWADLQAPGALGTLDVTSEQLEFLIFFREAMNGALANAKIVPVHVVNGPYHFDWIDSDEQDAFAFSAGHYSFIGVTTGFAKWVFGAGSRLCASQLIWDFLGLDANQTPANNVEFVLVHLALAFIVAHEYCHHVLGHQPDAIPESDPRTASLRGNLQSHTREVGADGYAAMHQYDFVIHSDFRSQMVSLLGI